MQEILNRHPAFTNPSALESIYDTLVQAGNLTDDNSLKLKRFHYTINHKITSAIYCNEKICNIVNQSNHIQGLTTTGSVTRRSEFDDVFQLAFYQDGFFTSLISCLDVLSLKVNLFFNNAIRDVSKCYFTSLTNQLYTANNNGAIEQCLNNIKTSNWYIEALPFRKSLIHRQQNDYTILVEVIAGRPKMKYILPDDPLNQPHTYTTNREITTFCSQKVTNLVNSINMIDGLLLTETTRIGHIPF